MLFGSPSDRTGPGCKAEEVGRFEPPVVWTPSGPQKLVLSSFLFYQNEFDLNYGVILESALNLGPDPCDPGNLVEPKTGPVLMIISGLCDDSVGSSVAQRVDK